MFRLILPHHLQPPKTKERSNNYLEIYDNFCLRTLCVSGNDFILPLPKPEKIVSIVLVPVFPGILAPESYKKYMKSVRENSASGATSAIHSILWFSYSSILS